MQMHRAQLYSLVPLHRFSAILCRPQGAVTQVYTNFTTNYLHGAIISNIRSFCMFRPYTLAIFRELQVRSMCTVYMAACNG
jgi:hypothetical protein